MGGLELSSEDEGSGGVTLSSEDEDFVAFKRDGRTYYGAYEGNTVTVSNCDPSVMLEIQDARGNVLEVQDPAETHTFVVPTTFEDGEAEQLGIYLTVHEHDWLGATYEWWQAGPGPRCSSCPLPPSTAPAEELPAYRRPRATLGAVWEATGWRADI